MTGLSFCIQANNRKVGFATGTIPVVDVEGVVTIGESNSGAPAPNASATTQELAINPLIQWMDPTDNVFKSVQPGINTHIGHADLPVNGNTHGIDLGLSLAMTAGTFLPAPLLCTNVGQGGARIDQLDQGGTYTSFMTGQTFNCWQILCDRLDAYFAGHPEIKTVHFYFSIGINDSLQGTAVGTVYTRVVAYINRIRSRYSSKILKFYVTNFLPTHNARSGVQTNYTATNTMLQNVCNTVPYCFLLDTKNNSMMADGNHWDYVGNKQNCVQFCNTVMDVRGKTQVSQPTVTLAVNGQNQITATITGASDADSFTYEVCLDPSFSSGVASFTQAGRSKAVGSLSAATKYYVRVYATKSGGLRSIFSTVKDATTSSASSGKIPFYIIIGTSNTGWAPATDITNQARFVRELLHTKIYNPGKGAYNANWEKLFAGVNTMAQNGVTNNGVGYETGLFVGLEEMEDITRWVWKYGKGNSILVTDWNTGGVMRDCWGEMFEAPNPGNPPGGFFIRAMSEAQAQGVQLELKAVIAIFGENDAKTTTNANAFAAALPQFFTDFANKINQVGNTYGHDLSAFRTVLFRISDSTAWQYRAPVRQAIADYVGASPSTRVMKNTDSVPLLGDNSHYTSDGEIDMGLSVTGDV